MAGTQSSHKGAEVEFAGMVPHKFWCFLIFACHRLAHAPPVHLTVFPLINYRRLATGMSESNADPSVSSQRLGKPGQSEHSGAETAQSPSVIHKINTENYQMMTIRNLHSTIVLSYWGWTINLMKIPPPTLLLYLVSLQSPGTRLTIHI